MPRTSNPTRPPFEYYVTALIERLWASFRMKMIFVKRFPRRRWRPAFARGSQQHRGRLPIDILGLPMVGVWWTSSLKSPHDYKGLRLQHGVGRPS